MTIQLLFLVSVFAAVASLVAAMLVARFRWRRDIAPFGRHTGAFKVLASPASYAVESAVPVIRAFTMIGYGFVMVAIFSLAYQLLADIDKV